MNTRDWMIVGLIVLVLMIGIANVSEELRWKG